MLIWGRKSAGGAIIDFGWFTAARNAKFEMGNLEWPAAEVSRGGQFFESRGSVRRGGQFVPVDIVGCRGGQFVPVDIVGWKKMLKAET